MSILNAFCDGLAWGLVMAFIALAVAYLGDDLDELLGARGGK